MNVTRPSVHPQRRFSLVPLGDPIPMPSSSPDVRTGVVLMVDALGMRDVVTPSELGETVRAWNSAFNLLWGSLEGVPRRGGGGMASVAATDPPGIGAPTTGNSRVVGFSDTVIVTDWESVEPGQLIEMIAASLVFPFSEAVKSRLLFRGAIGYGTFVQDQTLALGEAVQQVAPWYDASDWAGVFLSPEANAELNGWLARGGVTHALIEYDVPLSAPCPHVPAVHISTRAVVWPRSGFVDRNQLEATLKARKTDVVAPRKYANTLKFFEHVLSTGQADPIRFMPADRRARS